MSNKRLKKATVLKNQAPHANLKTTDPLTEAHARGSLKLDPSPEPHPRLAKNKN